MRRHVYYCRQVWFVAALLLSPSLSLGAETARETSVADGPSHKDCEHELWLISTRHGVCLNGENQDVHELDVRRYQPEVGWGHSQVDELLASEPRLTIIYVHGNRVSWNDAFQMGRIAYQAISGCVGDACPMRFVIWSWPSDQVRGPLRDVRLKADRADTEGIYLGWFLGKLPLESRTSLIGFSYGARVINGGLHLAGGGQLNGYRLPSTAYVGGQRFRAVYFAAAMDNHWFCEGGCHGKSLSAVDQMLVSFNPCDPALIRFRLTDRCTHPTAVGHAGIPRSHLASYSSRVEQLNVSSAVGKTHKEELYWCHSGLLEHARHVLCWE